MAALALDRSFEASGVHNRYFAVRHGQVFIRSKKFCLPLTIQSESNVQKIIVSNPAIGSQSYGLTDLGKEQAQKVLMLKIECTTKSLISHLIQY